ncbi:O-antigen ligase family protein [Marinobacteraceae bacterium S3BR75-40.1]
MSMKFGRFSLITTPSPVGERYRQGWLPLAGLLAVLFYTATYLLSEEIARYSKPLILLLGFGGYFYLGGRLRRTGPMWIFLAALAIVLLSWGLSHLHHPQWAEDSPKVHRLTNWTVFIAVAWLLGGNSRWTLLTWFVGLVALLATPWILGNGLNEWLAGLRGRRIDFGINNAQHTAMLFGIGFLGIIAFSRRFLVTGPWRAARMLFWLAGLVFFGVGVIITQTRGIWLGESLAMLVLFGSLGVWIFRTPSRHKKAKIIGFSLATAIALIGLITVELGNVVEKRLHSEKGIIDGLLSGEILDSQRGSIAYRYNSWEAAIPWIAERPIVGWGGNGRGLVLAHSEGLPKWFTSRTGHLHSSYVDILVNFGMLGLTLFLGLLFWTALRSFQAWKRGFMGGDMLTFYLAFTAFWLVVNITESYMFYSTGQYVLSLVLGGMVTHIWRMQGSNNKNNVSGESM